MVRIYTFGELINFLQLVGFKKIGRILKKTVVVLSFLCNMQSLLSQEDVSSIHSVGIDLLGNAGMYSLVYNRTIASKGKWYLQIRPQFELMPGSTSGEIPYSIVPIFGFNNQLRFQKWLINCNLSAGVDFSVGPGNYGTQWISAVTVGPKFKIGSNTWGPSYVYFFKEPEFIYMSSYPHSVGLSIEFFID